MPICKILIMKDEKWLDRLIEAIENSDLNYREISLRSGLAHGYVQNLVRNRTIPSTQKLISILQTINAPVTYIMLGVESDRLSEDTAVAIAQLTPEDKATVSTLVRSLASKQRQSQDVDQ